MRYLVLRPPTPADLRMHEFSSLDEMKATWPVVADCATEALAVTAVRLVYPDAVGFPGVIKVGSGNVLMLALFPECRPIDPGEFLPFEIFVYPVVENDHDRYNLKKQRAFDMKAWKPPVIKPKGVVHGVELRARDLDLPSRPNCIVGRERGQLVIYLELNGLDMSLRFDDEVLDFVSEAPSTVAADVAANPGPT